MGVQQHGGGSLDGKAGEQSEELADLVPIVFITGKQVRRGVQHDQLGLVVARRRLDLREPVGHGHPRIGREVCERVILSNTGNPSHIVQVIEAETRRGIDARLPAVQLVGVILAKQRERSASGHGQAAPRMSGCCRGHQLLSEVRFPRRQVHN